MTTYTIGALAEEFGVTLRTLRFYEGRGLLKPERQGAQRVYPETQRERLKDILSLRKLGFTVTEIRAGRFNRSKFAEQLDICRRQRVEIDEAIAELERRVAA